MRQIHGVDKPTNTKHACAHCRRAKSQCQGGVPCNECLRRGIQCSLSRWVETPCHPAGVADIPASNVGPPKPSRRFLNLYSEKFHPYWLFIHQGSFDEKVESPLLVQAMVAIGLWMSDQPATRSAAIDLHNTLALAISQQREAWDVSVTEDLPSAKWQIPTYQGILLHIIFALMRSGAENLGVDQKPSLAQAHTGLLDSLLRSCKRLGMFYYPSILALYSQSDASPYIWLGIEETKWFDLALYKVYQSTSRIGKRANNTHIDSKLTARDLQFPPPTNIRLWKAVSKTDWDTAAHSGVFNHLLDNTMSEVWISKVNEACDFGLELYHTLQG
ncbi:hypothetical protein ASPCAL14553 [Aspergillus calidoustus]|uniref:Zn(2)-C6 fungal-type domain-containing protein n=1 Tax=Aspergillus calidoustus TaxID=454130 RepID=A0A0U5GHC8_ASPCI|nr:hypothetical protein ASPCAL14553 [Aspergillus calidoustus]